MAVVLVLMPAKGAGNWIWNRQCAGVSRFARARGWEARFEKIRADVTMAEIGKLVESTDPVGVVSRLPQALPKAVSGGRPVVYFDCEVPGLGRRTLRHDVVRTVHLAARELFSLPLRDFAFAAFPGGHEWCRAREKTFAQEVRARHGRLHPSLRPSVLREPLIRREIGKWLKVLPRPCGVFAANDLVAENVIRVCRKAGLRVPEDIAVVGVDDDPVRCPRSVPTITSVMPDWEGGAFLAMASLARAVRRKAGPRGMEFRPLGLVRRGSTAFEVGGTNGAASVKALERLAASSGGAQGDLHLKFSIPEAGQVEDGVYLTLRDASVTLPDGGVTAALEVDKAWASSGRKNFVDLMRVSRGGSEGDAVTQLERLTVIMNSIPQESLKGCTLSVVTDASDSDFGAKGSLTLRLNAGPRQGLMLLFK